MRRIKPTRIFAAARPDKNLSNFSLNLENPMTGNFSNRKYFEQLNAQNEILYSLFGSLNKEIDQLQDVFGLNFNSRDVEIKESLKRIKLKGVKQHPRGRLAEKLPERALTLASLYSVYHGADLVLSDLPDIVLREKVINQMTVTQMKEILKVCSFALGRNGEHVDPKTPISMISQSPELMSDGADLGYQGLFALENDMYTALLLFYSLRNESKKNILILTTLGSDFNIRRFVESLDKGFIPDIFKRENEEEPFGIKDLLKTPDPLQNMMGKAYLEELIEKSAIWDVLLNPGLQNLNNIDALIEKYLDPEAYPVLSPEEIDEEKKAVLERNSGRDLFDKNREERELSFFEKWEEYQFLYENLFHEYQKFFDKHFEEGLSNLKDVYIKHALKR